MDSRARRLMRLYNLTLTEYHNLFIAQDGKCAICKRPASDFKHGLHVDHCHSSKVVRGLLCFPCNRAIPNRKDALTLVGGIHFYLQHPPAYLVFGKRLANAGKRGKRKKS